MSDRSAPDEWADLQIRLFPRQGNSYPVELALGGLYEYPRGQMTAALLPWVPTGDPTADGRRLFETLLADPPLHDAWLQAKARAPRRRLRLWIDRDAPELHTLPWELLHDGESYLSASANTPFSRFLALNAPLGGVVKERPLRILAVVSNPDDLARYDLPPLDVEREKAALQEALAGLPPGTVRLDWLAPPITLKRLEEELRPGYHILHFFGHGAFHPTTGQAALYLQNAAGQAERVVDEAFVAMLARQRARPRLFFLGACRSATQSAGAAWTGLGARLLAAGVPAVVAMQEDVTLETVYELSRSFYRALAGHGLVDLAVNEARSTLLTGERPDAAVPVLLMRLEEGRLWAGKAQEEEKRRLLDGYLARILEQTRYVNLTGIPLPYGRDGRPVRLDLPLDKVYIHVQAVEGKERQAQEEEERQALEQQEVARSPLPGPPRHGLRQWFGRRGEAESLPEETLSTLAMLGEYYYRRGETQTQGRPEPIDPQAALQKYRRLVILGAPGAGKSTLLRYLARRAAEASPGSVPILVSLRDFAAARSGDSQLLLQDFALSQAAQGDEALRRALAAEADAGRILWLVDALDEARGWADEASQQVGRLPGQVVLTSRPIGYRGIGLEEWPHLEVLPLTPENVDQFMRDWFDLLAGLRGEESGWVEARVTWLEKQLEERPGLEPLIHNPLLLTFLVILAGEDPAEGLPAHRAELYRRYVDELLNSWEAARRPRAGASGEPALALGPLEGAQARSVARQCFYYLGWALHLAYYGGRPRGEVTRPALVQAMAHYLQPEWAGQAEAIAQAGLDFWEEAGLLETWTLAGKDYLVFRHLTFQEYAAAWGIAEAWRQDRRRAWRFLRPRLHHYAWREPVLLLAGMMARGQLQELANHLLSGASAYERALHRDLLLAGELLVEGAELDNWETVLRRVERLSGEKGPYLLSTLLLVYFLGLFGLGAFLSSWAFWGSAVPYTLLFWVSALGLEYTWLGQLVMLPLLIWPVGLRKKVLPDLLTRIGPRLLPYLERVLHKGKRFVRRAAADALGAIGAPQAVPALVQALHDRDVAVRRVAADALGRIGTPPAIPALVQALQNHDDSVRWTAAYVLGECGDPQVVSILVQTLQHPDDRVREAAAYALRETGDPQAGPALLQALQDQDDSVRWAAVHALGKTDGPQVVPALVQALQDPDDRVREAAAYALREAGAPQVVPALVQALQDSDDQVRRAAIQSLGKSGAPQVVPVLVQALQDPDHTIRRTAAYALGKTGAPQAVPALVQALQDPDDRVREAAVDALGETGDSQVVPALVQALQDEDESVHEAAAEALRKVGDPQAVPALVQALQDPDDTVRWTALHALGRIGDPQVVPVLVQALQDGNGKLRRAVVDALGETGDPQVIPTLVRALQDADDRVRAAAAFALRKIGGAQALEPLLHAVRDKNRAVRDSAVRALGAIGDPRAVPVLLRSVKLFGVARDAILQSLDQCTARLKDLAVVRQEASGLWRWSMSFRGRSEALPALRKVAVQLAVLEVEALELEDPLVGEEVKR